MVMITKEQSLNLFHNAVGLAILEHLCSGNLSPKDVLEADMWSKQEIADVIKDHLTTVAMEDEGDKSNRCDEVTKTWIKIIP